MKAKVSILTVPKTFRLYRSQVEQLEKLPPEVSSSALVRVLLSLYLEGKIPEAATLSIAESLIASKANEHTQFGS